jgi:hypothetical protein
MIPTNGSGAWTEISSQGDFPQQPYFPYAFCERQSRSSTLAPPAVDYKHFLRCDVTMRSILPLSYWV